MTAESHTTPEAWREIARNVVPGVRLARGASARAIALAEAALEGEFPRSLRDLLRASNGVGAADGARIVLSVARVVSQNLAFRDPDQMEADLYGAFDRLLLFGEEGNGDVFGFDLSAAGAARPTIVKWDHETDARVPFATDLESYLRLRGECDRAEPGAGVSSPRLPAQVVSVWTTSHRSNAAFAEYIAAGPSSRVSKDGLPQSGFHADCGMSLREALASEQHCYFSVRPTPIRQLLDGAHGGEGLIGAVERRVAGGVRAKVKAAILVYGLRRSHRAGAEQGKARFLGSFRFD